MHVPDITTEAHKANPFPLYARLRSEAPVVRITAGDKKPAWLVSRYADVAAALKDPRLAKNPLARSRPRSRSSSSRGRLPSSVR